MMRTNSRMPIMFVGTALLVTLACVTFSTQSRHVGLGQARSFAARTSRLTPSTFRPTRLGFDKFLSDSVASRSMLCRAINKMDEPAGTKHTLVLVRHGESDWNARNLFTGWADVELSEKGKKEGKTAGTRLKEGGFEFDLAYTSLLKRAIETLDLCIHEMGEHWIPVIKDWRLNERHYGALEGLNKAETAAKHGEDMVKIWRRSYDIPPPPIEEGDPRDKASLRQYKDLTKEQMPLSESLRNTVERVIPYWDEEITRSIKEGKNVLVAAHGNSLRALVKHLDGISDEEITGLNIPTGIPLVYYLDADLKPLGKFYLASDEELESAVSAVANQGKAVAK